MKSNVKCKVKRAILIYFYKLKPLQNIEPNYKCFNFLGSIIKKNSQEIGWFRVYSYACMQLFLIISLLKNPWMWATHKTHILIIIIACMDAWVQVECINSYWIPNRKRILSSSHVVREYKNLLDKIEFYYAAI